MMSSKFFLHKGKNKRAEQGRPWIYIDEINEYDGDYENGDIVEIIDEYQNMHLNKNANSIKIFEKHKSP